jgi:hypothetical protein
MGFRSMCWEFSFQTCFCVLLYALYVIFGYSEREIIFLLLIRTVHSCKNLEKQTPTLEENSVQMLNDCVTKAR